MPDPEEADAPVAEETTEGTEYTEIDTAEGERHQASYCRAQQNDTAAVGKFSPPSDTGAPSRCAGLAPPSSRLAGLMEV